MNGSGPTRALYALLIASAFCGAFAPSEAAGAKRACGRRLGCASGALVQPFPAPGYCPAGGVRDGLGRCPARRALPRPGPAQPFPHQPNTPDFAPTRVQPPNPALPTFAPQPVEAPHPLPPLPDALPAGPKLN